MIAETGVQTIMYRLVVVEDENDVRSRIMDMIEKSEKNFSVIATYSTGIDAYEGILSDNPDLILTDIKIPFISGIELVKKVRETLPFVKIIFITGFSKFEYAKEAANLDVVGFINKPINFDELESVLSKAEAELDSEYLTASNIEKLSNFYVGNLPVIRENYLQRLSNMSAVTTSYEERLKSSGINLDYDFFMMCVFDFDMLCDAEGAQSELTYSTIKKTIDDEFGEIYDYELFSRYEINRYEKFCLLLKFNDPQNVFKLNHSFEHIVQRVGRLSDMSISVGISAMYEKSRNFSAMLKEAMRALRTRSEIGNNKVIFYKDIAPASAKLSVDDKLIRELSYMIRFQTPQECLERIDTIWETFKNANAPRLYAGTNILNSLIKSCDDLEELYLLYNDAEELYTCLFELTGETDMLNYMKKLAVSVIEINASIVTNNMENSLKKIIHYMEAHFCDPDISLEHLARNVKFSASYISVLLKKKRNTSFVKMLTDLRMEKAKELLTDPELKIIDIAERLGYNDSYYFSHCFKKYVGVSPREFKNNV